MVGIIFSPWIVAGATAAVIAYGLWSTGMELHDIVTDPGGVCLERVAGFAGALVGGMFGGGLLKSVFGTRSTAGPRTNSRLPQTLGEQLALEEAMSKPADAKPLPIKLTDIRWHHRAGWSKMKVPYTLSDGTRVEFHFVWNRVTGAVADGKISGVTQ